MKGSVGIGLELAVAFGLSAFLVIDLYGGSAPRWEEVMNAIGVLLFLLAAYINWQTRNRQSGG